MEMMTNFQSQQLYPRERTPGTQWIGGWMGPTVRLHYWEKRTFLTSAVIQIPDRQVRSLFTIQPTLSRLEKKGNYKFCP